jgi:hypothetical protein
MTTECFLGRAITVSQQPDGFAFSYDDGKLVTFGLGIYETEQEALDAAKEMIGEEGGSTQ